MRPPRLRSPKRLALQHRIHTASHMPVRAHCLCRASERERSDARRLLGFYVPGGQQPASSGHGWQNTTASLVQPSGGRYQSAPPGQWGVRPGRGLARHLGGDETKRTRCLK